MKTYEKKSTLDPKLFRVVDIYGEWEHYFDEESGRYLRGVSSILHRGYAKGFGFYRAMQNLSAEEWERRLKAGGERGTALHEFVRAILDGNAFDRHLKIAVDHGDAFRELTIDEYLSALAWARFWTLHDPLLVAHERPVKNLREGYAGTFDVILILRKKCGDRYCKCAAFLGKLGLWDLKTGPGIYDDHGPQIAAYANGDLTPIIGDRHIEYTAILNLNANTDRGWKTEFYDEVATERHWQEFLSAKCIDDATYRHFNAEKEIYDIPETLNITVEREAAPAGAPEPEKAKAKKRRTKKVTKSSKKAA